MKFRKLRIALSVFWAVATALLVVLWVRSYWRADTLILQLGQTPTVGFTTIQGKLLTGYEEPGTVGTQFSVSSASLEPWMLSTFPINGNRMGFGKRSFATDMLYLIPLYVFAIMFPACVALPWVAHIRHFSLRTLLTITTLVAALLGLSVWSSQ